MVITDSHILWNRTTVSLNLFFRIAVFKEICLALVSNSCSNILHLICYFLTSIFFSRKTLHSGYSFSLSNWNCSKMANSFSYLLCNCSRCSFNLLVTHSLCCLRSAVTFVPICRECPNLHIEKCYNQLTLDQMQCD